MDLNFNSKLEEYYQKFVELQEKLKRSEEQRFLLEIKFNEMTQVAKEEEQAHYRKLRTQYKKFLEEDQKRQDRNERIIRNLERIETKISMLSAKTERINMLRRQYQTYLRRIAYTSSENKPLNSRVCRERSFIKEEPLKEQQPTMFRDDYSLPERPKDILESEKPIMKKSVLEKPIFEHPAVKKALEKDRSNEEKIEILDRYLQSISSQRCRDLINQEQQSKDKLSLDTPVDRLLKNDVQPSPTNNAAAVADDIMNSIYSRYYSKSEVSPKKTKIDLQKVITNENKPDYVEKEMRPIDNKSLDSLLRKNLEYKDEAGKPTVNFKDEVQAKDSLMHKTEDIMKKHIPEYADIFSNNPKKIDDSAYFQNQNNRDNLPHNSGYRQGDLEVAREEGTNNVIGTSKNDVQTLQNNANTNNITNNSKPPISDVRQPGNNLLHENRIGNIDSIEKNLPINMHLEGNKQPHDSNGDVQNSNLKIESSGKDKEDTRHQDLLKTEIPEFSPSQHDQNENSNKNPLYEENKLKHQSEEQVLECNTSNGNISIEEPIYYHTDEQKYQANQQNEGEHQAATQNEAIPLQEETEKRNTDNQSFENSQPSIQSEQDYNRPAQHDQTGQQVPCDQNLQQYEQNKSYENAQPIQYNDDPSVMQYDENYPQPAQYDNNGQPLTYAEDPSYQQIQYDENGQSIQYDETGQPIQYDQQGEAVAYDQYGQPLLYDQNGQIVQPQYDENGQIIPQYDGNGQIIMLYDQNGQPVFGDQYQGGQQQYDLSGQPVVQYDENGQPIYDNNQQYYDYSNQQHTNPQNEYNQSGDIDSAEQQLQDNFENINNQYPSEESPNYPVSDQGIYQNVEENQLIDQITNESNQHQTEEVDQQVVGESQDMTKNDRINEERHDEIKPPNVMDILDTDTESVKQNTSKISNDSDFDFN